MSKLNWWKTSCAASLLCMATIVALPAQTFTSLHSFDYTDGALPRAGLIQGTDGNLYGTTSSAGANDAGTVFKITQDGTLTTLYSFCSQRDCPDGFYPLAGLVQGMDGNLYGTTVSGGGLPVCLKGQGCGTVFKIALGGTLTTLHSFDLRDGANPTAALVQGTDGSFYGTTNGGGLGGDRGTVFKISLDGTLKTLHSFTGTADGENPLAALIQATDGNFYGTTGYGGADGGGTVFRITPTGALTTLYAFDGTDGANPNAGLVQATDGNLYGTAYGDGANDGGTIFEITTGGAVTVLYSFCAQSGCPDGKIPYAPLVQDTNGNLYGTTSNGGGSAACEVGCGTVFSLSVGLGPFVETHPTDGKVGAAVKILGSNLIGATGVTFSGTPATFTVEEPSVIKATVPAGAATGTVQVVTPSGTLSSNVPFRVAP
jgi:uncharacterized repeat protein (TIGR03803 family)